MGVQPFQSAVKNTAVDPVHWVPRADSVDPGGEEKQIVKILPGDCQPYQVILSGRSWVGLTSPLQAGLPRLLTT